MTDIRQLVIDSREESGLFTGETSQIRLRGIPTIHLMRGTAIYTGYSSGEEASHSANIDTALANPVPKSVVAHWKKWGRRPDSSSLLHLAIDAREVQQPKTSLKAKWIAGSKEKEIPLELTDGIWSSPKWILLVYGDGTNDESPFEDVLAIDISKSGGCGFETEGKVEITPHQRKWGCIDFQLKGDGDTQFRTSRFGLFKGRNVAALCVSPIIGANQTRILLDDGHDDNENWIDITKVIDPAQATTEISAFPESVNSADNTVTGHWDKASSRSRVVTQSDAENPNLALFLLGENRVRIFDRHSGDCLLTTHFLIFENEESTIVGSFYGNGTDTENGLSKEAAEHHLLLDFEVGTPHKKLSEVLHAAHLIPQGYTGEFRLVQASPVVAVSLAALKEFAAEMMETGLPHLKHAGLDYLMADRQAILESYPPSIRSDFNAGTALFNNGHQWFQHHFYIHTFAAHRLIGVARFPDTAPPSHTLEGSHFELDKTFLLPSARDSLAQLLRDRQDRPQRKLALFGHADATGTVNHNNGLSLHRAEIVLAVLVRDTNEWIRRFDGGILPNELPWGNRELQHMLKALGLYQGPIDGDWGTGSRQAARQFLQREGLPDHAQGLLNRAAKIALIRAYHGHLTRDISLSPGDFFRDNLGLFAVWGCGSAFPIMPTDPNNGVNRRITFVLRMQAATNPIDVTLEGATAPYRAWIAPETQAQAQADVDAPFVVGCHDNGFGLNDDFRGDRSNLPNRWGIKGRRLVRPTVIDSTAVNPVTVFEDGDLSNRGNPAANGNAGITDNHGPGGNFSGPHGSGVMSCMVSNPEETSDLGGVARTAQQVVLGTGKDLRFRPIKHLFPTLQALLRSYEILRDDPDVKVVSSSLLFSNVTGFSPAQLNTMRTRMRTMLLANKVYFIAAANRGFGAPERDVARTEGGILAPARGTVRSTLPLEQRLIAAVGATNRVLDPNGVHVAGQAELPTDFTYLGAEVNLSAPGNDIRVFMPNANSGSQLGGPVNADGIQVMNIDGTSFATPMTAGIAGELLLVNPNLRTNANLPMVIEILEATADLLPSLETADRAFQRGPYLPANMPNGNPTYPPGQQPPGGVYNNNYQPNPGFAIPAFNAADPQLVAADFAGYRRVHFWKAVLAALNEGLPSEMTGGNGTAHPVFTTLSGKNHANTTWYGFEVRSPIRDAVIFLKRSDGSFVAIEDAGAALPGNRTAATAWLRTQDYKAPLGHKHAGFHLPAFPFPDPPPANIRFWFMSQFSIKREELDRFTAVEVYPASVTPGGDVSPPPLVSLAIAQASRMRNPSAITPVEAANTPVLAQISRHVQEFDDFVFHVTIRSDLGALHHFALRHAPGANAGEAMTVQLFAVDALGNLKADFSGNVNVSHTGTQGSNAGASPTGVFINNAPATTPIAIALNQGMATFTLTGHTLERFRLRATNGTQNEDGLDPEIQISAPGAIGSIRFEMSHFNGDAFGVRPLRAGDRIKATLTVLDTQGRTKTNFSGRVDLRIIEGQMGHDGPPKRGIHVADAEADAFDSNKFMVLFAQADQGRKEVSLFNYTTGLMILQAVYQGQGFRSSEVTVRGGGLDHVTFEGPNSLAAGNRLNQTLKVLDRFNNLIDDFEGRIDLSVQPPAMVAGGAGAIRTGVHLMETQTLTDDYVRFTAPDRGTQRFSLIAYSAGQFQVRASSVGMAAPTDSASITVTAPAALDHFAFEVGLQQPMATLFPVIVKAVDASGNVIPNFIGNVTFARVSGPNVTPVTQTQAFGAAQRGRFDFFIRATAVGALVLRARHQGISTDITLTIV